MIDGKRISLVVAAARNGVIGVDGGLPWRIPSDLKTFRQLTIGKPVIMGRRTYQSIGKPLAGRENIVVSRQEGLTLEGFHVVGDVAAAIRLASELASAAGGSEIAIIGGAQIYRETLPLADRIYLTRVDGEPAGDAVFPDPDPSIWRLVERQTIQPDPRDTHAVELLVFDRA